MKQVLEKFFSVYKSDDIFMKIKLDFWCVATKIRVLKKLVTFLALKHVARAAYWLSGRGSSASAAWGLSIFL